MLASREGGARFRHRTLGPRYEKLAHIGNFCFGARRRVGADVLSGWHIPDDGRPGDRGNRTDVRRLDEGCLDARPRPADVRYRQALLARSGRASGCFPGTDCRPSASKHGSSHGDRRAHQQERSAVLCLSRRDMGGAAQFQNRPAECQAGVVAVSSNGPGSYRTGSAITSLASSAIHQTKDSRPWTACLAMRLQRLRSGEASARRDRPHAQ